jgi:hypothetical protein
MNERIQQLWSQAEEEIKAEYEDESRRNRRLYNEIFLPKFAELIVRECMQVLDPGEHQLIARFHARKWLAEHFGVEE